MGCPTAASQRQYDSKLGITSPLNNEIDREIPSATSILMTVLHWRALLASFKPWVVKLLSDPPVRLAGFS
jgi:hypothetical protein